jgi:hypothetical protein
VLKRLYSLITLQITGLADLMQSPGMTAAGGGHSDMEEAAKSSVMDNLKAGGKFILRYGPAAFGVALAAGLGFAGAGVIVAKTINRNQDSNQGGGQGGDTGDTMTTAEAGRRGGAASGGGRGGNASR